MISQNNFTLIQNKFGFVYKLNEKLPTHILSTSVLVLITQTKEKYREGRRFTVLWNCALNLGPIK